MALLDDAAVGIGNSTGARAAAPSSSSSGTPKSSTPVLLDDRAVGLSKPSALEEMMKRPEVGGIVAAGKAIGGNAAAFADMLLSVPNMAVGLGANLGTQLHALGSGETGKLAAQAGREAMGTFGQGPDLFKRLFKAAGGTEEEYASSSPATSMNKVSEWLQSVGERVEKATGGKIPAEQIPTLVDSLMVAGGAKGMDMGAEAGLKAWMGREKPKPPPADFSPPKVQAAGPQRTAQQQINESLNIRSQPERAKYNAQRQKEVRAAFKADPDYADYLKFLAEERVTRHDAWNEEQARLEEAQHSTYTTGVSPAKPEEVTWGDALRILKKPGFERTAEELIALRRFNQQKIPFVATAALGVGAGYGMLESDQDMTGALGAMFIPLVKGSPLISRAESMAKRGVGREEIWKETGAFRGEDGVWRRELSDEGAALKPGMKESKLYDGSPFTTPVSIFEKKTLGDVLDHPELFKEYPHLKDTPVMSTGFNFGIRGAITNEGKMLLGSGRPEEVVSTILHETQHSVQEGGRMARGGSPDEFLSPEIRAVQKEVNDKWRELQKNSPELDKLNQFTLESALEKEKTGETIYQYEQDQLTKAKGLKNFHEIAKTLLQKRAMDRLDNYAYKQYKKLTGEVEARATEARRGMTAAERRETPPWKSYDVPEKDWLIRFGTGQAGAEAVKGKGGMWHPEAVERLAAPLADTLIDGTSAARDHNLAVKKATEELGPRYADIPADVRQKYYDETPSGKADNWAKKAIRNYLNKHAGTESDPLKDVEIPFGEGTKRWEELTDSVITGKQVQGPRGAETQYGLQDITAGVRPEREIQAAANSTHALTSYLSHVGDYLRQNVSPEKLSQYDLVRAVKETAANDARVAKEMEKAAAASTKDLPVYKDYGDGFKWVELKLPEKLTEEQAKGVRRAKPTDVEDPRGEAIDKFVALGPDGKPIRNSYTNSTASADTPEQAHLAGQLAQEGNQMGHCVGGYCEGVASGESRIFSLRDAKGRSHVTIEIEPGGRPNRTSFQIKDGPKLDFPANISQIKGKQNRAPSAEYLPYVQDFVKEGKWGEVGDLENTGLAKVHKEIQDFFPGETYAPIDKVRMASQIAGSEGWKKGERGFLDPRLAARMAAVGLGIGAGVYLDPSNPAEGGIVGALAGLALSSVSPKGVAAAVKKAFAADDRLRINTLANDHEYRVAAAARGIHQLQSKIERFTPNEADRIAITHAIEKGDLSGLSPQNRESARLAQEYFKEMAEVGRDAGVLKDALGNYVTHLWRTGSKGRDVLQEIFAQRPAGPSMSPESKFALRRTVPTLAEGKAKGLTPVSEDISTILGLYGNSINRSLANKQMLGALKAEVDPASGNRLVMPSGKAPPAYVSIDHPQMAGLRVHPDIAPSMRFIFDHSDPGVVMRGLEGVNTFTKRMAVSFSLFHAKALTDAFIGAAGNPLVVGKQLAQAAAPKIFGENVYLKQLREGGAGDLVDMAQKGGLKFSMERSAPAVEDVSGTFYTAMKDLEAGLDGIMPGLGLPARAFTKLNHAVDRFMWGRLHSGMKLSIFADKYSTLLENNALAHEKNPLVPLRPKEEIAGMAADFINSIFGGLNWRRVAESASTKWGREAALAAYSPTGRRIMQVLLFAPDWTISTTRAALQAFGEGSGLKGLVKPEIVADLHRQYLVRSAIYYVAVGDAINYSMSGHHLWENKDPTTIDLGDGRTMQWSKHTMEPVHWLTKPGQQGLNKLGFIPRETANQLLGTEYLSTSGHAPRMKSRLGHVAKQFTPISVQQNFEAGNDSGIAGFLGAPIYGKTTEQKERGREERRLKRLLER